MLKVGIIAADKDEYIPIKSAAEKYILKTESFLGREIIHFTVKNIEVTLIHCGIGKVNAAVSATHLIDCGCDVIINYGFSGGINRVRRGDICLPDRFLEHDFDLTGIGYKPCEKPEQNYIYHTDEKFLSFIKEIIPYAKTGTAVTGDCFVNDENKREFLKNEFNACCCDMETAAIAYVSCAAEVPFISIRKISDDAGAGAAETYREMNNSHETDLSELIFKILNAMSENYKF